MSWAGPVSHEVASALAAWLPSVLQTVEPFVSSETDKGTLWLDELSTQIAEADFAILCVTRANVESQWLHFEAGALARRLKERTRVAPVLFRITQTELVGPLVNFQAASTDQDDLRRLVETMNRAAGENALDRERLANAFEMWWPRLETTLDAIEEEEAAPPRRSIDDILSEILAVVRSLSRQHGIESWESIVFSLSLLEDALPKVSDLMTRRPRLRESWRVDPPLDEKLNQLDEGFSTLSAEDRENFTRILGIIAAAPSRIADEERNRSKKAQG